ncbi:hypothetical protein ACFSSC_07140 [Corynebacterium mendelii]|uniref:Uncharacterized protein n=1 Tax=Corynebacterium mendelii TaxID=2765362 RepID=A0A939E3A2_9CORY|nr:hypothetical protein [Corynebacterium mendelii]MBN9644896.1 hypothetical protein [Corynebacterium mendelii]
MSFFEDLASVLDEHNIEQRITEAVMHIPVSGNLDLRITVDNEVLPAANIRLHCLTDDGDDDLPPKLLAVVFSVSAAVDAIVGFLETADAMEFIDQLIDDPLGRISELDFTGTDTGIPVAYAPVGDSSQIMVEITRDADGVSVAEVAMVVCPQQLTEALADIDDAMDTGSHDERLAVIRQNIFDDLTGAGTGLGEGTFLSLGSYTNFDRLMKVLPFIASHAAGWEQELVASDSPAQYSGIPQDVLAHLLGLGD